MAPAEASTSVKRGTDWSVGLRALTSQGNFDFSAWTATAKLFSSSGSVLKTITGILSAEDCFNFSISHTETAALTAQNGRWEIMATRTVDGYTTCLVSGRATIL
jgi:hypothetical protein